MPKYWVHLEVFVVCIHERDVVLTAVVEGLLFRVEYMVIFRKVIPLMRRIDRGALVQETLHLLEI
jgi:hypothetical protein